MKTVIVKRSQWLRGEGSGRSYLLRSEDRKMCCLGFACIAFGLEEKDIMGITSPGRLRTVIPSMVDEEKQEFTPIEELMSINDSAGIDDFQRESELNTVCEKYDLDFIFKFED